MENTKRRIPNGVYRLMSLTGASLSQALFSWNATKGDFYSALLYYEERYIEGLTSLAPPETHQTQERKRQLPNGLTQLLNPGSYFVKGFLMAATIIIAAEAL